MNISLVVNLTPVNITPKTKRKKNMAQNTSKWFKMMDSFDFFFAGSSSQALGLSLSYPLPPRVGLSWYIWSPALPAGWKDSIQILAKIQSLNDIYIYNYIHIYLEPKWPLFLKVFSPQNKAEIPIKTRVTWVPGISNPSFQEKQKFLIGVLWWSFIWKKRISFSKSSRAPRDESELNHSKLCSRFWDSAIG